MGTPGLGASMALEPVMFGVGIEPNVNASSVCSVISTPSNRFPSNSSSKSADMDSPRCSVRVLNTWLGRTGVLCDSRFTFDCPSAGGNAKSACLYRLFSSNLIGLTFIACTFFRYSLSYRQLPRTLPNVRNERFSPSVAASFLAFSKDAALPLPFSMEP